MIPKECKRLAEVDFPIAVVSAHSAQEKSIRHGHPSTLHLWWARRPLAACRAILLALLLPDPCDDNCPAEFKEKARNLLNRMLAPATAPPALSKKAPDLQGYFCGPISLHLPTARIIPKSMSPAIRLMMLRTMRTKT